MSPRMASLRQGSVFISLLCSPSQVGGSGYSLRQAIMYAYRNKSCKRKVKSQKQSQHKIKITLPGYTKGHLAVFIVTTEGRGYYWYLVGSSGHVANIPQCTGQSPTTKNFQAQNVSSAEVLRRHAQGSGRLPEMSMKGKTPFPLGSGFPAQANLC